MNWIAPVNIAYLALLYVLNTIFQLFLYASVLLNPWCEAYEILQNKADTSTGSPVGPWPGPPF